MRACVIFNPTARGNQARRFRAHLDEIARGAVLKLTQGPGDARRLAAEAVREGCDTIVAAGGDGTLNEVLNGLAAEPGGLERARLGVLPLGTVNVFAKEFGLPTGIAAAWAVIQAGREFHVDLPCAEFGVAGRTERRWFAQLGGAGLDARAIEWVDWKLKQQVGPLAYVWSGLKAVCARRPQVRVTGAGQTLGGELVLLGNGALYGGRFRIFPQATWQDGLLEVAVFPRAGLGTAAWVGPWLLLTGRVPAAAVRRFRAATVELDAGEDVGFELDGEWVGRLPVRISVARQALRVVVP